MTTVTYELEGIELIVDSESEYINVTLLSSQYRARSGKRRDPGDWLRLARTKETLEYVSSVTNIPVTELVKIKQGLFKGKNSKGETSCREQGTFLHPKLAIPFANWLSPKFELTVTDLVLKHLIFKTEENFNCKYSALNSVYLSLNNKYFELNEQYVNVSEKYADLNEKHNILSQNHNILTQNHNTLTQHFNTLSAKYESTTAKMQEMWELLNTMHIYLQSAQGLNRTIHTGIHNQSGLLNPAVERINDLIQNSQFASEQTNEFSEDNYL